MNETERERDRERERQREMIIRRKERHKCLSFVTSET
jgi:hypothetical protein